VSTTTRSAHVSSPWRGRVDSADWDAVAAELDEFGGALTGPLLNSDESSRDHFAI
jgi:hypothetical protein